LNILQISLAHGEWVNRIEQENLGKDFEAAFQTAGWKIKGIFRFLNERGLTALRDDHKVL
jgi:hypothetical protein